MDDREAYQSQKGIKRRKAIDHRINRYLLLPPTSRLLPIIYYLLPLTYGLLPIVYYLSPIAPCLSPVGYLSPIGSLDGQCGNRHKAMRNIIDRDSESLDCSDPE